MKKITILVFLSFTLFNTVDVNFKIGKVKNYNEFNTEQCQSSSVFNTS